MGSCISSEATAARTAAAAAAPLRARSISGRFIEKRRLKKMEKASKGGGGGGSDGIDGGGGGLFDRRVDSGGQEMAEELLRAPGRMFSNGASEVACLHTQQGRKGTNQDAMIVWENFNSRSDTIFCGVFDGHGPFGHFVAKKVRDSLPVKLCSQWRTNANGISSPHPNGSISGSMNSEETASVSVDEEWSEPVVSDEDEKLPEMYLPLKQSFIKAFKLMDKELKLHPTIDCFCSGSTAVTFVKQGQDLVFGNLGDSRAVLGARDKDNNLIDVQLTVDLKPNLPREAARIQQYKGRVFALQDEPEVARVWLPNNDSPGLAMARAFGDFCLKDYGLISVPEVSYHRLTEKDEFIILATDGVWDVLSNKEAVDIVASAPSRATAARALVDCAVRAWRLKFPTSKCDDCAVVCLFLDPKAPADSASVEPVVSNPTDKTDREAMIEAQKNDLVLAYSYSKCDSDEIVPVYEEADLGRMPERSHSTRSLADCIALAEEEEWSALKGVTRVNTLLNVPRFSLADKRSGGSWRRWL